MIFCSNSARALGLKFMEGDLGQKSELGRTRTTMNRVRCQFDHTSRKIGRTIREMDRTSRETGRTFKEMGLTLRAIDRSYRETIVLKGNGTYYQGTLGRTWKCVVPPDK